MLKKHGLKVSSLYISQIKQKCGLALGQSYNFLKKKDAIWNARQRKRGSDYGGIEIFPNDLSYIFLRLILGF